MQNGKKRDIITLLTEKNQNGITIPELIRKTGMKREEVLYKLYKLNKKGVVKAKKNPNNLDIKAEIEKELTENRRKIYQKHRKRISKAVNIVKNKLKGTKDKIKATISNGLSKFPSKDDIRKNILRKELISYNLRKEKIINETKKIQSKKEIPELIKEKPKKINEYKKEIVKPEVYAKPKEHLKKIQENKKYNFSLPIETGLFLDLIEKIEPQQIKKENNFLENISKKESKYPEKVNKSRKYLDLGNNFITKTKKYFRHNKNKLNKLKSRKLFKWPNKEKNNFNIPSETENFLNLINPEYKAERERRFFKEQFWKRYREKQENKEPKSAEKDVPDEKINNEKGYWKKHLSEFYKQKYEEKKELNQEERKALRQTFSHHFMKKKELNDSAILPLIKSVQEHFKIESKKREPVLSQDPGAKRNRENIYRMLKERGIDAEEPEY